MAGQLLQTCNIPLFRQYDASLRCGDAVGNPCVFNSSLIPQLLSLEGDKGGRSVAKKHDCVYVDIADERELMDIDTYLIR